jgi:hypothetical protein
LTSAIRTPKNEASSRPAHAIAIQLRTPVSTHMKVLSARYVPMRSLTWAMIFWSLATAAGSSERLASLRGSVPSSIRRKIT